MTVEPTSTPMPTDRDDDWYDRDPVYCDDEDEWEIAIQDCGLDDEGFCHLMGTEHCDFDCPFRDEADKELSP